MTSLLAELSSVPNGTAIGVDIRGCRYIVIHYEHQIYVYENACPHLHIPLEWLPNQFLDAEGELIRCATHGALFTIEDGMCISGPCNGQSLNAVAIELKSGQIHLAS